MNIKKQGLFGVVGTFLGCSIAIAGDMGPIISSQGFHPVVSLQGGYASMQAVIHRALSAQILMCLPTIILEVAKTLVLLVSF